MFCNEFEIELQPKDKNRSSSKNSSNPRSGKRKRRAISPIAVDHPSPYSTTKKDKKKLDFNKKTKKEEASSQ